MFEREVNEIHREINNCLFSIRESMIMKHNEDLVPYYNVLANSVQQLSNLIHKINVYHETCKKAAKEV